MAAKTTSKIKKELDRVFSLYIRQRNANSNGTVMCFTCGTKGHWKTMDCGHFQSRKHTSTRWDEQNCQVQCKSCNIFKNGEQYKFGLYIDQFYGKGIAEYLHRKAMRPKKMLHWEMEQLTVQYKIKIKELTDQS
jgi:hypothetical protein